MKPNVNGYTNDDVNLVLAKIFENSLKDRDEALQMFNLIKSKINANDPSSLFLLGEAKNLLETAMKQNDVLVKLAGVMQRLQTNMIIKKSNLLNDGDYKKLLKELDDEEVKLKIEYKKEEKKENEE